MTHNPELYLEAHVTIEPIPEVNRPYVSRLIEPYGFKLAHLIMLKGNTPSQRDTFMTTHGKEVGELAQRTRNLVTTLKEYGVKVWRYKIETCVIDSRQTGDLWGVLDPDRPELPLIACEGCQRI